MTFGLLTWKVFLLLLYIAVGFMCRKINITNELTEQSLTNLLMKVTIPCLLIASLGTSPLVGGNSTLIYCGIIFTGYYLVCLPVLRIFFRTKKLSQEKMAVATCMVAFPNITFFGFTMLTAVLGPASVSYGAVMCAVFTVIFFTYGMSLFQQELDIKSIITPVNIATIIMLALFIGNVHLPEKIHTILMQFGSLTMPIALIVIGGNIANSDLMTALKNKGLYAISFTRLVLIPVLLMACIWPLQMSDTLRMALLIGIACPTGWLPAVVAKQTNMESEFASQAVIHCTFFSVLTMPVLILAMQYLLG